MKHTQNRGQVRMAPTGTVGRAFGAARAAGA